MTDRYPKSLIRRFAKVAAFAFDDCEDLYGENPHGAGGPHSADYIEEWEDTIEVLLNNLGFHETAFGYWRSAPFEAGEEE